MRSWRRAVAGRPFGGIRYLCSLRALPYVDRAVSRTKCESCIEVEALEERDDRLSLAAESRLLRFSYGPEDSLLAATGGRAPEPTTRDATWAV